MRHLLVHALVAFALLMQGFGGAWAAGRMAAAEVQMAAQLAELPPCHQQAAKAEQAAAGMTCCGTASCQCVMGCGVLSALSLAAVTTRFSRQLQASPDSPQPALLTLAYGPPLRPPAALQS